MSRLLGVDTQDSGFRARRQRAPAGRARAAGTVDITLTILHDGRAIYTPFRPEVRGSG